MPESWVEKNISLPFWTKVFKAMGLYDEDYHEKYRKYIREKRYAEYIDRVIEDIQNKIHDKNKKQIEKMIKEKFPEPEWKITVVKNIGE